MSDATEAAVELADAHGIDLDQVEGTGTDGRVTKQDVEDAIDTAIAAGTRQGPPPVSATPVVETVAGGHRPKTWDG